MNQYLHDRSRCHDWKIEEVSLSNNKEILLEIMIKAEDLVENLKIRNLKQSTLDSWFYKQNKHN